MFIERKTRKVFLAVRRGEMKVRGTGQDRPSERREKEE